MLKRLNRNLAVFVIAAMILSIIPAAAFAGSDEVIEEITAVKDTALVEYGTPEEDALSAVEEGTLFEGTVGEDSVYLDVENWQAVEYDPYEPAEFEYTFEGEAQAPEGYEFAEDVDTMVEAKVTVEIEADEGKTIKGYIQDLVDMGLSRTAGSEAEDETIEYLLDRYADMDYDVEVQEYRVGDWGRMDDMYLGNIEVMGGEDFYGDIRTRSGDRLWTYDEHHGTLWETSAAPEGAEGEVEGELFYAEDGLEDADFPAEVDGQIALIDFVEDEKATQQVENALEAGAEAVIFSTYGQVYRGLTLEEEVDIPVLSASSIHGGWLQEMMEEETVEIELISYVNEDLMSHNVVATREAESEDAPIFHITGHLDSVPGSPGASDNASGTVMVLKLAQVFEDIDLDAELRFVHFGAEEVGWAGAWYYVDQLSPHEQMRSVNFNFDMVCNSDPDINVLTICPSDDQDNFVTDMVMAADEELGYGITDVYYNVHASDHGAFHMEGIPAAVAAYQGDEPFVLDPNYHTPIDTVEDNVSEGRIQKAFDIHKKAIMMADEAVEVPDVAQRVHMYIDSTTYEIDGVEEELDVAPFVEDDRTFVPVRFIAEAFAAEADWTTGPDTGRTEEVTLKRRDMKITIAIGEDSFEIYDKPADETDTKELDVPAHIKDGRTMLPFRAIGEAFGADIGYSTDLETGLTDQVWFIY